MLKPVSIWLALMLIVASLRGEPTPLQGTAPLTMTGDITLQLVDGAHRFIDAQAAETAAKRSTTFKPDTSSTTAFVQSLDPYRARLAAMLGVVDVREPFFGFELLATTEHSSVLFDCDQYAVHAVRWPVVRGVHGEGLLIEPKSKTPAKFAVIVLSGDLASAGLDDRLAFVGKLAAAGIRVLLPVLIDRGNEYSVTQNGAFKTGLTNREFCYRPAFELARHVIGYEVQKVIAAAEGFIQEGDLKQAAVSVGIIDLGGLGPLGLYAMALSPKITFGQVNLGNSMSVPMAQQPLDQNVFGLANEFGFAELASLITPRTLVISEQKEWTPAKGSRRHQFGSRGGPSPTILTEFPETAEGDAEWADVAEKLEASYFLKHPLQPQIQQWQAVVKQLGEEAIASLSIGPPASHAIDVRFAKVLGVDPKLFEKTSKQSAPFSYVKTLMPRLGTQVAEIVADTQYLLEEGPYQRDAYWEKTKSARDAHDVAKWSEATQKYRDIFRQQTIGHFDVTKLPANARTRQVYDTPAFIGYEVVLDVYPELIAYGILLVPKGIKEGERRPVVVTQHGLEGRPQDIADPKINSPYYNQYGCRLAERGFVVFAPQNLYIFHDRFRHLQRKLNPIGKTLFSVIVPQHEQIVDWLETLPFVDGKRIGFYGLSYGGKSAMRIPALVEKYALSICSADFNDWVWKNASTRSPYSYVNTMEYEIFEFGLGPTFNYAEMAALIAPRPFMVERGHHDGVGPDDRVASEYAKIRLMYADLKIPDRTDIEFFDGPHTIHGVGTFRFLHQHLNWPSPSEPVPLNK